MPGRRQPVMRDRSIPEATVGRLPVYLRALVDLAEDGAETVSSDELAEAAGVNSAKVRKDLSHLGSYGTRGVGYDVAYLIHQIRRELGLTQHWAIVIVGIGNLGHALANYAGFAERGFRVAALVDADEAKVGMRVGELEISHVDALPALVEELDVAIGVIATPAAAAQEVADRLVEARVRSVLNFAPTTIVVPPGVSVRKVDLAVELQILAFYEQRKATLAEVKRRGKAVADIARG
ncbi:MAG TPA: redox-sensing transcriptional repressor Rex [Actinomycetota bacterium]|nr:redox-sensing transcriptional repressor Rex [Actinomycetota bacterium]